MYTVSYVREWNWWPLRESMWNNVRKMLESAGHPVNQTKDYNLSLIAVLYSEQDVHAAAYFEDERDDLALTLHLAISKPSYKRLLRDPDMLRAFKKLFITDLLTTLPFVVVRVPTSAPRRHVYRVTSMLGICNRGRLLADHDVFYARPLDIRLAIDKYARML